VFWLWLGLGFLLGLVVLLILGTILFYFRLRRKYLPNIVRIFQELPLFIIPRGQPVPVAEDVSLVTEDGRKLSGCYLKTVVPRKGVILFGLEFGSNRWACVPYCELLIAAGYDIFSFEFRGQGESEPQPGYKPLQWVTEHEVCDMKAALAYLKQRPDADPRGLGFFGISKGGGAGLLAAADDPSVRCFVTDGIFATWTTMLPYMRKWVAIYNKNYFVQEVLPDWFYGLFIRAALRQVRKANSCRFPSLERTLPRLAPRPLLMIHGGADTYIKPNMAQQLFGLAREPKELWLVEGAKHNQALQVAGDAYRKRVLDFFETHLANGHGETRRQGDRETGRQGDKEQTEVPTSRSPRLSASA
jgi:predicted alpha/beta hydrolase